MATATAFKKNGAEVVLLDIDQDQLALAGDKIAATAIACDVTQRDNVEAAFAKICEKYGGVDVLVSNAGRAWQGKIGEVQDEVLRRSFELNFFLTPDGRTDCGFHYVSTRYRRSALIQCLEAIGQPRC